MYAFLSRLFRRRARQKQVKKKIIGIWHSADGSELNILKDGTFVGKFLPAERFALVAHKREGPELRVDGKGKWKLQENKSGCLQLELEFTEMNDKPLLGTYSVVMSGEWDF